MSELNRAQRRQLKNKLAPIAKEVARLERKIKTSNCDDKKQEYEKQIGDIMEHLSMVEMLALEDYIYSKELLDTK